MNIDAGNVSVTELRKINVLLGKNGCGKSTVLRQVETSIPADSAEWGVKRYVTPERGGALIYQANVEQQINNDQSNLRQTRLVNQYSQFREQSVVQFRKLELKVLRDLEAQTRTEGFQPQVDQINRLLDNIEIRRSDTSFKIFRKGTEAEVVPASISSGESELISLGIECLAFAEETDPSKQNLLCLDEPDVHLHPDLQARLVAFLVELVEEHRFTILLATHSTAMLGELSDYGEAAIAFMKAGDTSITFRPITEVLKKILPVFGAHPLSNVFNQAPVLLLEGEDDERLWQQAVRSANGVLKLYPVACGSVSEVGTYEQQVKAIADSIYDGAVAFSLRDRDTGTEEIADTPPIRRMKLRCRAAENLILSDEVLAAAGKTWAQAQSAIDDWLAANAGHARHGTMQAFKDGGYDRMASDLKLLRVLLVGQMLESNKPWEVLVGQVIGQLDAPSAEAPAETSILNFLGPKAVENLLARSS